MEKNNTKLFLEVDASQIDVKQLLKKDFLELSMRAISSANPNRNNSWFTEESMEKSKDSFINKPILGYFENGDFVSHNGDWTYDSETEMNYWDTLGKKGERILGIIRESDQVQIIKDSGGLSWITFTCALWTQYSFKQVKRLIKDAKRAQKTGESTKNISVEVDITDYEMLGNGVMKINEFNLVGVTILGARNGVKVEPGIENAELSVLDVMGRDLYSAQEKTLRLAYEKLNNSVENKEEPRVENENITLNESQETLSTLESCAGAEEQSTVQNFDCGQKSEEYKEEICPDCGQNPCACSAQKCAEDCGAVEQLVNNDNSNDEDNKTNDEGENQEPTKESCVGCGECEGKTEPDPIHDVAWLISDCCWNIQSLEDTMKYYEESEVEHKDYIIAVLGRILTRQVESEKELGALLSTITNGITEDNIEYEAKMSKYSNIDELIQNYESTLNLKDGLTQELESARVKVAQYEHQDFLAKATKLIKSANLNEELSSKFMEACDKLEINTIEDLKVQVAISAFEANAGKCDETITYTAPVSSPDTTAAFAEKTMKPKKNSDPWSELHDYIGK